MRIRSLFSLLVSLCVCVSLTPIVRAQTLVIPPEAAAFEGNTSITGPLGTAAMTIQWLFDNTTDPVLFNGDTLYGIAFVQDGPFGASPFTGGTYSDWSLTISTTTATADTLSSAFGDNVGPDPMLVRSGAMTIDDNSYPVDFSPTGPNSFGPEITFDSQFVYSSGNLLFTLTHRGRTGADLVLDAVADNRYGYLAAEGENATDATFAANLIPVMRLSVVFSGNTPEPSPAAFLGLTGIAVMLCRWRLRKAAKRETVSHRETKKNTPDRI